MFMERVTKTQVPLALELPSTTSFDEWKSIGRTLRLGSQALNWHIGDWWRFGVSNWGEEQTREAALDIWGVEGETARNYGWVASKFSPVERSTELTFSHYLKAASLPPDEAQRIILKAANEGLSVRDVQREVQTIKADCRPPIQIRKIEPPKGQLRAACHAIAWFAEQLSQYRPLTASERKMLDTAQSYLVPVARYKATAKFTQPVRIAARWEASEMAIVETAVKAGLNLHETTRLLPYRNWDSVKDRYYQFREPQDRDEPAALSDARRQKDAREGSARLLDALRAAGFVVDTGKAA